jgi:hypothetical protein
MKQNIAEEKRMKDKKILIGLCGMMTLAILAFMNIVIVGYWSSTWAAEGALLADKHKNAGIDCNGCHKENPPKEKVPTAMCMNCHGNYAKLAEQTQKGEHNTHDTHLGELDCDKCHHSHKPSADLCGKCHNFSLKTP